MSRIASGFRAFFARLREMLRTLARALRDGARGESPRRRRLWVLVALLLVLGPLVFNLARAGDFKASIQLFPTAVSPYKAVYEPGYYRALLQDPQLRQQLRFGLGEGVADYEDVTIRRGPQRGRLTMTVAADTPTGARRFVNALGPQLGGATQRQLARAVKSDSAKIRARLRTRLSRDERSQVRRQLRRLDRLPPLPPGRVLFGANAPLPPLAKPADRFVDSLPGEFRGRPHPAWAAFAGLLVALTLWAIALVLVPPTRRQRDGEELPQPD